MTFKLAALALSTALIAGCTESPSDPASFDGSYRLQLLDGQPIQGSASLNIHGDALSGEGPCNRYTTSNGAEWPLVALAPIASTRRACLIEGGESGFFDAMAQVTQASLSDGVLDLTGPRHSLKFLPE
ncbi:META domain-containing protein [Paracoccus jeotgali]|uniref:META domain-containing protein n=1 Tax=Paracoccus jeotgali TaxID=2065379 RepID=UPI0028A73E08|nr:META domain-containing protein [Paracoccus jeotgali]